MRALMLRSRWPARRSALLLMLVLPSAFGLTACGANSRNSITVLGTWTGQEKKGFLAMVEGFEKTTGLSVNYIGTRDADAVLASGAVAVILLLAGGLLGNLCIALDIHLSQ